MNLEGLIPIIGGIFVMLVAAGKFPKNPKNPEKLKLWRDKYAPVIKFLGPFVILFGCLQLFWIL